MAFRRPWTRREGPERFRWVAQALGWTVRRGLDLAMRLSGWSGRRVRRRWFPRVTPATAPTAPEAERRVHPLFWLGLILLAGLAMASPFLTIGAITLLVMLLRPVAVLAMALGVLLKR